MKQSDVAKLLGSTTQTIRFWERGRFKPRHQQMAKLIEFLGYDPLLELVTPVEQLMRCRQPHGLSQRALAKQMDIDPGSFWAWETGEHRPCTK